LIIVLGARSYIDGKPNPCLVARVEEAASLASLIKGTPTIILSGGNDIEDGANEAETMYTVLSSRIHRPATILIEGESTSTYENILYSKKLISGDRYRSFAIVTEPFHVYRANLVAQKQGLIPSVIIGASQSPCWQRWKGFSRYTFREIPALIKYKLMGYI
jgi:uncharacterized SAM-binding protein YcdF (DUF218 family)